jgi:hypothetical protein
VSAAHEQNRISVSIDDDVAWLTEQINALKKLSCKDDVDEEECYDLSIRWGTALAGRLRRLVHYSSLGQLNDADQQRYYALRDEICGLSDSIHRFGFAQPVFADSPAASAKRHRLLRRGRAESSF